MGLSLRRCPSCGSHRRKTWTLSKGIRQGKRTITTAERRVVSCASCGDSLKEK